MDLPFNALSTNFGMDAADLDGDGRQDIVIADYLSDCVQIIYHPLGPSIISPLDGGILNDQTPTFKIRNSNQVAQTQQYYKIEISIDGFKSILNSYNQTVSASGWSKGVYTTSETCSFNVPQENALSVGKTYSVRARCFDGYEWSFPGKTISFSIPLIAGTVNVPNLVFTPNNDGMNDTLIFSSSETGVSVKIFNQSGRLIRELLSGDTWDGKDKDKRTCPSGIYLYQIKESKEVKTGTIVLVR
jgi:gliding motility-associated-like protein